MSGIGEFSFSPVDFTGRVRLFPLPNLVVFPNVMQPLHIFEPRYRQMFEEALASDGFIAMSLLAPGWEQDYEGRPAVHPVACLCRIATHHRQDDGTYNVLLVGLRRIRLGRELPPAKLFRETEAELIDDQYANEGTGQRSELQRRLLDEFKKMLHRLPDAQEQLDQLLGSGIALGMLTDIIAYTLEINVMAKQALLSEPNVDHRAQLLLRTLAQTQDEPSRNPFPPEFSLN